MAKQITVLVLVVWFLMAVFTVRTLSQSFEPPPRFKKGMTDEEHERQLEEWAARRHQQLVERNWQFSEGVEFVKMELRKRTLGVTEQQWKLIGPKYRRVQALFHERHLLVGTNLHRSFDETSPRWYKFSQDNYYRRGKAPADLSEGEKIAEELIDLLANGKSKNEEIRLKIDALQRAREKARNELPKARQELREVLIPRQQAILQLWEILD